MVLFNSSTLGHFNIRGFNAAFKSLTSRNTLTGLTRRIAAYREMKKLQNLDNRMLRDIGLERSDLDWAMDQANHMDPFSALQNRRCESLHAQHLATAKAYCAAVKV